MGKLWTILSHLHSLAGPTVTLLYPLYASVQAMESSSKLDDEQWLAYWILYSFITLMEMVLQSLIYWIPIWYELKLLFMAWLVLPNFRGAAFIYNMFVREQVKKHNGILAATDADGVSNNVSADKDKITLISPKEKKPRGGYFPWSFPRSSGFDQSAVAKENFGPFMFHTFFEKLW